VTNLINCARRSQKPAFPTVAFEKASSSQSVLVVIVVVVVVEGSHVAPEDSPFLPLPTFESATLRVGPPTDVEEGIRGIIINAPRTPK